MRVFLIYPTKTANRHFIHTLTSPVNDRDTANEVIDCLSFLIRTFTSSYNLAVDFDREPLLFACKISTIIGINADRDEQIASDYIMASSSLRPNKSVENESPLSSSPSSSSFDSPLFSPSFIYDVFVIDDTSFLDPCPNRKHRRGTN
ncbi:hypothetical protein EGR_09051 [Echinococcus granulosus]|uniref:Uncharacterized protein n=1 Tax=Echinococcus granulosus TaxID=6210 RepID=W6U6T1_ECHGR|nr:hypothetical protein EGR_09051 [Echinococcus granulosus]EUB56061.1 hypothetical protein EGR_09051 [Echinococcus granulosus]